jgi:hypothetical protein
MARIRSLKPEFFQDRKLARQLTRDERMLYAGLWGQADEWSRANGDVRAIKGQVFPYDDDISLDDIETMLKSLEAAGRVHRYDADGDPYLYLPKLEEHQRLEPSKVAPRYPAPPDADRAEKSAPFPDESAQEPGQSAPVADSSAPSYGSRSMEHGAGPRDADEPAKPTFEDFYAAYPRHEARRKAEQAWRAAIKRASPETIMAGLASFRFSEDRRFVPLPASWLNADRWADQQTPEAVTRIGPGEELTRERVDEILGPDLWQLPPAPMDPEDPGYRAWCRRTADEHRAERIRQALAKLDRVPT